MFIQKTLMVPMWLGTKIIAKIRKNHPLFQNPPSLEAWSKDAPTDALMVSMAIWSTLFCLVFCTYFLITNIKKM